MQEQTASQIAQQARETLAREKSEEIQGIMGDLASIQPRGENVRKLQEDIFRNVFLPMFAGQENPKYDIKPTNWVTYAGSPHASVDVVDPQGNVLFRVPPLMQHLALTPINNKAEVEMRHVVGQTKLHQNHLPIQAESYLMEELTKRLSLMKSDSDLSENEQAWIKIFQYYGLLKTTTSTVASQKPVANLNYEDVPP